MASFFKDVQQAPPIEVFALTKRFTDDKHKDKVNLGVGAYRDDKGKPWVLPAVRQAELQMANDDTLNHEYLPVAGLEAYRTAACALLLGHDHIALKENRVLGIQSQGGTGALRLAAEFLKRNCKADVAYVSNPTWGNHKTIFAHAGFQQVKQYRYWNADTCSIDLDGLLEDLRNAPKGAVIILHAVAHNPTGCDPKNDQWKEIAKVIQEKELFPLMDCAYQGFATGDLNSDAWAVRYFAEHVKSDLFIAQSFSKNFGLYNERIGNLCVVAQQADMINAIKSQLEICVRTMWSNPSSHGARIVATILNNATLSNEWKINVRQMAERIQNMRQLMVDKLRAKQVPGSWGHITEQIGMFSYTGLNEEQSKMMTDDRHIYMLKSGRISMAGVTGDNVEYIVDSIKAVLESKPGQSRKMSSSVDPTSAS